MKLEASLKHFSPQGMHISDDVKGHLCSSLPLQRNGGKLMPFITRSLSMFARARVLGDQNACCR